MKVVAAVGAVNMADNFHVEKFSDGTAQEWTQWLEDYCVLAQQKKRNASKTISNLRFFVAGTVQTCVRRVCAERPTVTLEAISSEVIKLLGGTPDPLVTLQQLDRVLYGGNIRQTLLTVGGLIPMAYPMIKDKAQKDQMTWIHLQKLLPAEYQRDLIKAGVGNLDKGVEFISAIERADTVVQMPSVIGLNRTQSGRDPTVSTVPHDTKTPMMMTPTAMTVSCFACGLSGHIVKSCPFRDDICGRCERRGHLSVVCRGRRQHREAGRGRGSRWGNGRQPVLRGQRQAADENSTMAPLTWLSRDQPTTPEQQINLQLPQQQLQRQPWMPQLPPLEPQQTPEQQLTQQQLQQRP